MLNAGGNHYGKDRHQQNHGLCGNVCGRQAESSGSVRVRGQRELREAKRVSEFKAKFIAQGYDEVLAEDTAKAMADGDSAKVFANQQKFLDEYAKQVKADALKKTPKPTPGAGGGTGEMDYAKKIEEARTNGDFAAVAYYTRLQAEAEAQAKKE